MFDLRSRTWNKIPGAVPGHELLAEIGCEYVSRNAEISKPARECVRRRPMREVCAGTSVCRPAPAGDLAR